MCLFNREGQTTQRYASRASYFFSTIFFSNRKMCVCFVRVCVCVCMCVYSVCTLLRTSADYRRIKTYGRAPKPEVHVCVCVCACVYVCVCVCVMCVCVCVRVYMFRCAQIKFMFACLHSMSLTFYMHVCMYV